MPLPARTALAGLLLTASALALAPDDPYGELTGLTIARPEDRQDAPSTPPPSDAIPLFDGTAASLASAWVGVDGKTPATWAIVPGGAMEVTRGSIRTRRAFDGHFRLHVEFRVPYMPKAKGQARGNSGVYVQGRYEVQVLDSYGLKSQDNDCGGLYKIAVPRVNACKAPTVWQTYDIDFQAPRYDEAGKLVTPARISVVQNGQTIHEDVPLPIEGTYLNLGGDPSTPGPIMLQDHGNPVQFRNLWIQPLK